MTKTNKTAIGILLIAFLVISGIYLVSGADGGVISLNIVTANNTEFNTGLPSITANVTGNCSLWYANLTINKVVVTANQIVLNTTNTVITATTSTNAGIYQYNVSFWNETCIAGINQTGTKVMEVNSQPSVSKVFTEPGIVPKLSARNFTVNWTDTNGTGIGAGTTDRVNMSVCKTDAFGTSCTGGSWCVTDAYQNANKSSCNYTVLGTLTAGTKNYYIYLIDDNGYVSSSSSGTFTVGGGIDEEEPVTTTTTTTTSFADQEIPGTGIKLPYAILIFVIIIIAVAIVLLNRRK